MNLVKQYEKFVRDIRKKLGERVFHYRHSFNPVMTQTEFAKKVGMSRVYIGEIETGHNIKRHVRKNTVEKIERFLDKASRSEAK